MSDAAEFIPNPDDPIFRDTMQKEQFLELVAEGAHEVNAAYEVGWTPWQMKSRMKEPGFKELVQFARDRADGDVQLDLKKACARGNVSAISMWLLNRKPDEWRDIKRIEVRQDHTVSIGVVASVKDAALQLLREQGVAPMQILGPGPTIVEVEARDDY